MAGYIGSKAVLLSTTAATVTGNASIGGNLTLGGNIDVSSGTIKLDGNYPVGTNNVALGDGALDASLTGNTNTAIGSYSLTNNTSGASNTGLGFAALGDTTTGSYNTAIGRSALENNTTASYNTSVGHQAGFNTTTGGYNTFIGTFAGEFNTNGNSNTFVGDSSGYQVTTGAKNTILGRYNGNQGGLDIRSSSNNIVLSDGDGNIQSAYDYSARTVYIGDIASRKVLAITPGSDVTIGQIENNSASASVGSSYIRLYFAIHQSVGSRALRLTFSRSGQGSTTQFRLFFSGEYPTDSIAEYLARIGTAGGSGLTYTSHNYVTGSLAAGSWTNSGGTSDYYWQQAGSPIASSGSAFCCLELMIDNNSGPSGLTISHV